MSKRWRRSVFAVWMTVLAAFAALPFGTASASAATAFSNVAMNTSTPAKYDKFEMTFDLSAAYSNPFNPDEVDVRAYFTTPGGQTEVVPAFYRGGASSKWAVRYAPRQAGTHSVYLKVTDGSGTGQSATYLFTAGNAGANRGFMGVSGSRFVDSYGRQLTLIGTNYAWGAPSEILAAMPQYKAAKMNLMRVWYSVWWGNYAPEWGPTVTTQNGITMSYDGIGKYQLENQARMDTLMDTAAANDIYVILTMNSFGDFYYDWPQNAYNTANGGPSYWSENNTDFWTNATAIAYQKKLLRYVFARWGYSRALGMVEYWNESDNRVDTDAATRSAWHSAVDNYWKSLDFYHHPTTTSFAWKDHKEFNQQTWESLTTLNATNYHQYDSATNAADKWETELKHFVADFGGRPAFIGEFGINGGSEDPNDASVQRYVHDGLWVPVFRAGAAGGSLWWEFAGSFGFNVPANIKALHTALANFVQPEEQYLINMPFSDFGAQANGTKAGGYKNADRALLWINDPQSNYTVASPRTVSGMSFTVPGMNNGTYDITYYNTVTGTNISTTTASAAGGSLTLPGIPAFTRDIAVKAVRQGSTAPDTQAPTAPANLAAPSKTDTAVSLTWSASTDNVGVSGYDIYKGAALAGSTTGDTSFTVTGLTAGTSYTFTVKAKDAAGNVSAASAPLTVTTNPPDTTPPSVPTGLASPSKTDTTVTLSWTASTDNVGVTAYDVYRNGAMAGSASGGSTTFTVTGLTANTAYSFTVKARDAAGNVSAASGSISVTTLPPIPPNLLQNPSFDQDDGNGRPNLWTCEQTYYCYRDTAVKRSGSASFKITGTSGAWFGFYQDVAATAGTSYTFDGYMNIATNAGTTVEVRLQYLNGTGGQLADNMIATTTATTSGFTNVHGTYTAPAGTATARVYVYVRNLNGTMYFDDFNLGGGSGTGGDTQAPSAPNGLTAASKTDTSVSLSWTASTDNVGVTGYDIYNGTTLAGSTTGATTFTVSGLAPGTAYSFTVKAKDAAGNVSAASGALGVTTNAPTGGGTGSITREYWTGIGGTSVSSIPLNTAPSGTATLTSLEGPTNWGDNYGDRIRGFITPSVTGAYTFYLAGDDDSELWLSADGNPANKAKIAYVSGWTGVREWTANASQQSVAKTLTAGQSYYVEVLHKEGSGADHLSVGWTGPGFPSITVIDGSFLSPYSAPSDTQAPSAPTGLTAASKTDTSVSLSWTASTDNIGVTGYDIYNGTTLAGSTTGATTFTVSGLAPGTAYSFTVKAKDAAGNVSAASGALSVTTNAPAGGGSNLLLNPGFETGNGSGKPASWVCEQDYYCYSDTSVKRSGSTSLRVDGTSGAWFAVYQAVAGTAGKTYTFDGYLNITRNTGTRTDVKVQFLDGSGAVVGDNTVLVNNGTTTAGFTNVYGAYAAPVGTASVRVYVYFTDLNATLYLDDFSLISN